MTGPTSAIINRGECGNSGIEYSLHHRPFFGVDSDSAQGFLTPQGKKKVLIKQT